METFLKAVQDLGNEINPLFDGVVSASFSEADLLEKSDSITYLLTEVNSASDELKDPSGDDEISRKVRDCDRLASRAIDKIDFLMNNLKKPSGTEALAFKPTGTRPKRPTILPLNPIREEPIPQTFEHTTSPGSMAANVSQPEVEKKKEE